MNLETVISEGHCEEIRQNYEEGRFTEAIKDSIFHLSSIIREKANVEGDGVQLVSVAFGGTIPRIKVTKLQSENDKNIQRGVESLLRGIYQAVRNPRSHDKYSDPQPDADAIVIFIDYLIRVINQSKAQFSVDSFVARVFDGSFVKSQKYARLLVAEIPAKRRMDVMFAVLQRREKGEGEKLHFFFYALLDLLDKGQQDEVFQTLSEELQLTDESARIRSVIQILKAIDWSQIHEIARLRIENKFILSIAEGLYNRATDKCSPGALGTWATGLFPHFTLKTEALDAISERLFSDSIEAQDYGLKYFARYLWALSDRPTEDLKLRLIHKLKQGDQRFYDAVKGFAGYDNQAWFDPFQDAFRDFAAAEEPLNEDDVPF